MFLPLLTPLSSESASSCPSPSPYPTKPPSTPELSSTRVHKNHSSTLRSSTLTTSPLPHSLTPSVSTWLMATPAPRALSPSKPISKSPSPSIIVNRSPFTSPVIALGGQGGQGQVEGAITDAVFRGLHECLFIYVQGAGAGSVGSSYSCVRAVGTCKSYELSLVKVILLHLPILKMNSTLSFVLS
jgi:hypothetical protein